MNNVQQSNLPGIHFHVGKKLTCLGEHNGFRTIYQKQRLTAQYIP